MKLSSLLLAFCLLLGIALGPAAAQAPPALVDLNTKSIVLDGYGQTSAQAGQVAFGNGAFVVTWSTDHGNELHFVEVGQAPVLVKDVRPGPLGSAPRLGALVSGQLYFAADDGQSGLELWRSDGTAAGTQRVHDVFPGPEGADIEWLTAFNGGVAFAATTAPGQREFFWTDGTPGGLAQLTSLSQGGFASWFMGPHVTGNTLLFAGVDASTGMELYASDGTPGSATLLADMAAGIKFAEPAGYLDFGGFTYIKVISLGTQNAELWRTDGTPGGTGYMMELGPAFLPEPWVLGEMVDLGGQFVFSAMTSAEGGELWVADGTPGGTHVITNLNPPGISPPPMRLHAFGGEILFTLGGNTVTGHEAELWKAGPTAGSAQLVKNLHPTAAGYPDHFTSFGGRVFFTAQTGAGASGRELWSTDGTSAGTLLEADIAPGAASSDPSDFVATSKGLLFSAWRADVGRELWSWVSGQTALYADLQPGVATGDSNPTELARVFGLDLYWAADDGVTGSEPYVAPGGQGAVSLGNLNPFGSSAPHDFTGVVRAGQSGVLFAANDGLRGDELWWTDGTASGTGLYADIVPGGAGSNPAELTELAGAVYFVANKPGGARELWRTTLGGVQQLTTGVVFGGSAPDSLVVAGGRLFFTAVDANGRRNVFSTAGQGVTQHTQLLLAPSARPVGLANAGGRLVCLVPENDQLEMALVAIDPASGALTKWPAATPVKVTWNDALDSGFAPAVRGTTYAFFGDVKGVHEALVAIDVASGAQSVLFAPAFGQPAGSFGVLRELTWVRDALYFAGGGNAGDELYRATLTPLSGQLAFDATAGGASRPTNLTALGDDLVFSVAHADAVELQGDLLATSGGAVSVLVDLTSEPNGGNGAAQDGAPRELVVVGPELYFAAQLASGAGREVYVLNQPGGVVVDFGTTGAAGLLTSDAPVLGKSLDVHFTGVGGQQLNLLYYSAVPPTAVFGGPADPIWLDPSTTRLALYTVGSQLHLKVQLPADPAFAGLGLGLQVLTVDALGQWAASNAKALFSGN